MFVPSLHPLQRRGRNRRAAAGIEARVVADAVKHELPDQVGELVKRGETLSGQLDQHRFDIVLKNGKPLAANRYPVIHTWSYKLAEAA